MRCMGFTAPLFVERQGHRVIRFGNVEVYAQIDRVCDAILVALDNG